jgi:nucleoside-diphosphate-sugar epimerase
VFEAAAAARCTRLVYTSSVAAYGFDSEMADRITEEVEPRGTDRFYYSAQKAELETLLLETLAGSDVDSYIFRPVIVAGPDALLLRDSIMRSFQIGGRGELSRAALRAIPLAAPILPDPGVPIQLVHHDDVARALVAAIEGHGTPGIYNLAAPDPVSLSEIAHEFGWRALPIPRALVPIGADLIERLQDRLPQDLQWINAMRKPTLLDTSKGQRELGWYPRHSARATLRETAIASKMSEHAGAALGASAAVVQELQPPGRQSRRTGVVGGKHVRSRFGDKRVMRIVGMGAVLADPLGAGLARRAPSPSSRPSAPRVRCS